LLLLGSDFLRPTPLAATALPVGLVASKACVDFASGGFPGSAWTLPDCLMVWEEFISSAPEGLRRRLSHVDVWRETAEELRRAGSPCLVASDPTLDGAGSSTIRHFATWIYAEQMGCDWVTPDWGKKRVDQGNGTAGSPVIYCHRTATTMELDSSKPPEEMKAMQRCTVIDWLSYFQFGEPSVPWPHEEVLRVVQPTLRNSDALFAVQRELYTTGFSNQPWDRVVLSCLPLMASQYLLNVGSWDEPKREIVRNVLQRARDNFHRHPRPWYDGNAQCSYGKERLHFAVHVRMGDRREFQDTNARYFDLLELIMDGISAEVMRKGMAKPLFHVFSETVAPCPSGETGVFDEFPTWSVGVDKIPECLAAPTPLDCPEKRAGAFCSPIRSGIFEVLGKNIVLHVGSDVKNALSCMIQADGVLMGCSTFGQVAGLLTKGISMFSMTCGGTNTPEQYKIIPPIAVAERGRLWVPIAGSWRDPALTSNHLFAGALETLIAQRGLGM
ncbi:unnamed protein product, partial [Hapterophycus canaliculatus]